MKPFILVVCGDAGGAAAIAPVAAQLKQEERVELRVLAYHYAASIFHRHQLAIEELAVIPQLQVAEDDLQALNPALLLTGTTWRPAQPEKAFIAAARAIGVPSLTVLDYWSNYRARFNDDTDQLTYLPDLIAVMDQQAYLEMLSEGFPSDKLSITGAPHLNSLAATRSAFTLERRAQLRESIGTSLDEVLILFASQPLSALYGNTLGYTEHQVLAILINALEAITQQHHVKLTLVVRPHPREDPLKYSEAASPHIRIVNVAQQTGREWAMTCDVIAGMNTELLLEACYLGCLTISLQPGLRLADMLPTNRSGLSLAAYTEREIQPLLERVLFDSATRHEQRARLTAAKLPAGGTQNVVDLVYQMCRIERMEAIV